MSISTNTALKFVAKEITRNSLKKMVLSKADMKSNFLYFSMSMSVNKLVCKCNIEFCGENRNKVLSKNLLPDTETNLLQVSVN